MNPKVDAFLRRAEKWQEEFRKLRSIILDCGLTEELKWGVPCYTLEKNNIVLMHGAIRQLIVAFNTTADRSTFVP
jgi:uncharacterized protein YdeI (YjbR/CyaY-like superfamily)